MQCTSTVQQQLKHGICFEVETVAASYLHYLSISKFLALYTSSEEYVLEVRLAAWLLLHIGLKEGAGTEELALRSHLAANSKSL